MPKTKPIDERVREAVPIDWESSRKVLAQFPVSETAPASKLLVKLEREGKIEVRMHGNPPEAQIRKAKTT